MKGGVAAIVVAAEELAARGSPGRVVLVLVADEEDASLGTEAVLEALPGLGVVPDVALVGEPTWLALAETLRGYALVEVTLCGRAAHSSQPELGVNAVAHLGRLLTAVEARAADLPDPGGSLMVTVATGGDSPFVLARSARALVERRTVRGRVARRDALAEVEALLDDLRAADPSVVATARLVVAREAWRLDARRTGREPRRPARDARSPRAVPSRAPTTGGSTRPTGWRRRSGRRPASRPSSADRPAEGSTRSTSGSTSARSSGTPSPSRPRVEAWAVDGAD